jgi:hypothetical protein
MSYFRSYFEKNNTIIKNSQVNTAKNPTTEIFYGSSFSKFLFKVDFTELKNKVNNSEYILNSNTRHTLHLTNCIFGDETFLGAKRGTGRERTNSFDLILFKVPEFWDEGLGFDYEDGGYDFTTGNKTFDERPSNWFNRTTLQEWASEGVYSTSPNIITTIHFDNGNEDIDVDITDYVNDILDGETNHGLGLAFALLYEDLSPEVDQSVSFFTKYTQTFFEPYVESFFDDTIQDNRLNFIEKAQQNLYLYVTKGTNFYNLDTLPTVDILDSTNTPIAGLTGLTTIHIKKGVYKVTFGIDGVLCDGKRFFFDKWKGLSLDGVSISNVTQKFIPYPYTSLFTVGENQTELQRYSIQYFGIKQGEKVKRGDKRKVVVTFRSIDYPKTQLFDDVYYRMFIKEGRTDVIVHDWTKLDTTNENSFTLDTSIYVPREYFIELKGKTHTEEIFYDEHIKFEILSEK